MTMNWLDVKKLIYLKAQSKRVGMPKPITSLPIADLKLKEAWLKCKYRDILYVIVSGHDK